MAYSFLFCVLMVCLGIEIYTEHPIFETCSVYCEPSSVRKRMALDIQKELEVAKVVSQISMRDFLLNKGHIAHFTSSVDLVKLESDVYGSLNAVLKIDDREWPRDSVAEVAAYRASSFLDLHLVPPTVFYEKDGIVGSLQYYVEPSLDLMVDGHYERSIQKVAPEDLANMQLFYFVFGQWDQDPSNMIIYTNNPENRHYNIALIDNAAMGFLQKVQYGDHPFVLCFPAVSFPQEEEEKTFPFEKVRILPPDPEVWHREFGDLLNAQQRLALCRLKRPIRFVIWKGHLWRQYQFGQPACTDFYPSQLIEALKKLNYENVKQMFHNDWGVTFTDEYYRDILERRDQVIDRGSTRE